MYDRSDGSRASIRSFLFPCRLFFRGSQTANFETCGFSRWYNQVAQVPSSNVICNSPQSPWIKSRIAFARVLDHAFHHCLSGIIPDRKRNTFLVHIHPDILFAIHLEGAPFCSGFEPTLQTYSKRGALLYCVERSHLARRITRAFDWIRMESTSSFHRL